MKLLQEWVELSNLEKCTAHPSRPWKLTGNEIIPLLAIKPDMGERWLVLLFLNIIISFLFHFNGLDWGLFPTHVEKRQQYVCNLTMESCLLFKKNK